VGNFVSPSGDVPVNFPADFHKCGNLPHDDLRQIKPAEKIFS
jgi:hypothetical protein